MPPDATTTVQLIKPATGVDETAQTHGLVRRELIAEPGIWVGLVHTPRGSISGWHHHGEFDTYIYAERGNGKIEFGPGGAESFDGQEGNLIFVPQGVVHREANPGSDESVALVIRLGRGEPVFNVEAPCAIDLSPSSSEVVGGVRPAC